MSYKYKELSFLLCSVAGIQALVLGQLQWPLPCLAIFQSWPCWRWNATPPRTFWKSLVNSTSFILECSHLGHSGNTIHPTWFSRNKDTWYLPSIEYVLPKYFQNSLEDFSTKICKGTLESYTLKSELQQGPMCSHTGLQPIVLTTHWVDTNSLALERLPWTPRKRTCPRSYLQQEANMCFLSPFLKFCCFCFVLLFCTASLMTT